MNAWFLDSELSTWSVTDCLQIILEKGSRQNFTMSVNNATISTTATTTTASSTTVTPPVDMAASCKSSMS